MIYFMQIFKPNKYEREVNKKMLDIATIIRLEKIVERLNNVLEQNLIDGFKSKKINATHDDEMINHLLSLKTEVSNLSNAREAKELLESARNNITDYQKIHSDEVCKYLISAAYVAIITTAMSYSNFNQVFCEVTVQPVLKQTLKYLEKNAQLQSQIMQLNNLLKGESEYYKMPGEFGLIRQKSYKLVRSEETFNKLLKSEYTEITNIDGIKIAFKKVCTLMYTAEQKLEIRNRLKELIPSISEELLSNAVDILFPDVEYSCTYQIYIPSTFITN